MLDKIAKLYDLISHRFSFKVINNELIVSFPEDVNSEYKSFAKLFIKSNKEFIKNAVYENDDLSKIIHFDLTDEKIPLSLAQEKLWFVEKFEEGSSAYNVPMAFELVRMNNIEILNHSIHSILNRHEVLRTLVKTTNEGSAYQFIIPRKDISLNISETQVINQIDLDARLTSDAYHIFDLKNDIPIRIGLYHLSNKIYLSVVIHHIAFDGWSADIFMKELCHFYNYHTKGLQGAKEKLELPNLVIQYKDFSIWQKSHIASVDFKRQLKYWKNKLDCYENLNLLKDGHQSEKINYIGKDVHFNIEKKISSSLRDLAKRLGVSLYSVLLSAYYLMLKIYSRQSDLIVGVPAVNRHHKGVENLIGFFSNSLAIRVQLEEDYSISDFIHYVAKEVLDAQSNQDIPFEKIVEKLEIDKDLLKHPVFQVIFSLQSFGGVSSVEHENMLKAYQSDNYSYDIAKLDMSTYMNDSGDLLVGYFNYSTTLYNASTINKFIDTYKTILKNISCNSEEKISSINVLDEVKFNEIIYKWNNTDINLFFENTLPKIFEEQVLNSPNALAVMHANNALTYQQLNEKANQLAHYLNEQDVGPDTLVIVSLERSIEMIISILGVLKVGGAYVPISPDCPLQRFQNILDETQSYIILTDSSTEDKLPSTYASVVLVDESPNVYDQYPVTNFSTCTSASDLACVVYTSGTTGKPKGVMLEHKGIINTLYSQHEYAKLNIEQGEQLSVGFLLNFAFDASVSSIFLPLLFGHKLVVSEKLSEIDVVKFLNDYDINMVIIASKMLPLIGDAAGSSLRTIILGGERPEEKIVLPLIKSGVDVIQEYGVTEASIASSHKKLCASTKFSNIGRPLANVKCYILDENLQPLPIGAVGELYISGIGLARGYLDDVLLTDKKFIDNPFVKNSKLYKTGDLACWNEVGELEYIARNDFQIKLRGYRIEPSEIECVISDQQGVMQNVVVDKEVNNRKSLVCYYLADKKLDEKDLIKALQSKLPDYMLPQLFIHLKELPLTENGKLNRAKLPEPIVSEENDYMSPRNDLERCVSKIWADLLGVKNQKIGINDDFFRLGGDSIVSIQIVGKIRQELGLTISVKDIFTCKTIATLCDSVLKNKKNASVKPILLKTEQGLLSGQINLLPIQAWFFENSFPSPHYYNQSFSIKTPSLSLKDLQDCLTKLVAYHDAFRIRFKRKSTHIDQFYNDSKDIDPFKTLDVSTLGEEGSDIFNEKLQAILTEWQSKFNIETGPMYIMGYLYGYKDGSARVYFALHHLIVDSVSWRIIADDLRSCFEKKSLPSKGSSYRQWVKTVENYSILYPKEEKYWLNLLNDFKGDSLESLVSSNKTRTIAKVGLTKEKTASLLKNSNMVYHTEINDLLLSALSYALMSVTNNKINYILLEGHGREEIDETIDITKTIGWFTTMFPVRLVVGECLAETIKNTKECLREIPNKGVGYGAIFSYKSCNLPKVGFNYLGQFTQDSDENQFDKMWSIVTDESVGIPVDSLNEDPNIISINGLINSGKLEFNISTKLSEKLTGLIARCFKEKLHEIIEHTSGLDRTYLTASDVNNIITQRYLDELQKEREISHLYLANSLQQGFIYHGLNQGMLDDSYRIQFIWNYHTKIDEVNLEKAWKNAQSKYACLRLRFSWENSFFQIIDKNQLLDWRSIDLTGLLSLKEKLSEIESIKKSDMDEIFQFDKGNLFRVYLIKQNDNLYTCIFSYHHILFDGWSNSILINYVHNTYLKLIENNSDLNDIDLSYVKAQKYLQDNKDINLKFWKEYTARVGEKKELISLLTDSARAANLKIGEYRQVLEHNEKKISLDNEVSKSLKELGQREGVTLNVILQFAWHKILSVYSNSTLTVVGTTFSGRNLPIYNLENSVGLYINTLPVIFDHDKHDSKSIIENIREIQKDINDINARSTVNLVDLHTGSSRLFDNLFIYENYPTQENQANIDRLKLSFENANETFDYPLVLVAYELGTQIIINFKYANEIFNSDIVSEFLSLFLLLLKQISTNPYSSTSSLFYLGDAGYKKLMNSWNMTDAKYTHNYPFHKFFEEKADLLPDKIALIFCDIKFTYKQLNERSNQLANYLLEKYDFRIDESVMCCFSRSEQIIIAILAIMKMGCCYVPVSPDFPEDRIKFVLKDTECRVTLCDKDVEDQLNLVDGITEIIAINTTIFQEKLFKQSIYTPKINHSPNNLAYIIYTSGTTGIPKGVMIEHKSLVAAIISIKNKFFQKNKQLNTYSMTNYIFDIFGLEYGLALFSGGIVTIGTSDQDFLDCSEYDFIQMTPSMCEIKLNSLSNTSDTKLFIGGEKLTLSLLRRSLDQFPEVINFYGPTETTIWSTYKSYTASTLSVHAQKITIGLPLTNERCYVLDQKLRSLPVGAIGELYIGGVGLARGYLNNKKLSCEKFLDHSFSHVCDNEITLNERLYKTGDLVCRMADGELEYISRNDFQIKYRGYRIELSDIENNISSYNAVRQNVVVVMETNTNKILVCYYVADLEIDKKDLQTYLKKLLPTYMIPQLYIRLDKLPLMLTGKIDRKNLPAPKFINEKNYIAPRSIIEVNVCEIWAHVLGILDEKISIKDDFFDLGGNSIMATIIITQLNKYYNVSLKIADIYVHSNIEMISEFIKITLDKNDKQLIVNFNGTVNKPNLFMIHPATGGCEVYLEMANELKNDFNCLGIDSYNLYNSHKKTNLNDLASYYLSLIDKQRDQLNTEPYTLLGWSLGGNIVLEIATLLEKKGVKKINICLLDSVLSDDVLLSVMGAVDIQSLESHYKSYGFIKNYDESYIRKVVSNIALESSLLKQDLSSSLKHTRIILFKPMMLELRSDLDSLQKFYEHVISLEYNNIDKVIQNISNLEVIKIPDAHHMNILEKKKLLSSKMKEWLSHDLLIA